MHTLEDIVAMKPKQWWEILVSGHPIDPESVADWEFDGVSLGQPKLVQKISWLKFKKVFKRDPELSFLRGWNVSAEQTPLSEPWADKLDRKGRRQTYWSYGLTGAEGYATPAPQGLIIDYDLGDNPFWHYINRMRDPLIAVNAENDDLLLGYSYVSLGGARLHTPTWFALRRGRALEYDIQG